MKIKIKKLYLSLLVGFSLFCQIGCGGRLSNQMIDQLRLDPERIQQRNSASANPEDQQQLLKNCQEILRKILKGEQHVNAYINRDSGLPMTVLGIMIELEGKAGVKIPANLLQALVNKGMNLQQVVQPKQNDADRCSAPDKSSPLNHAIICSAIQTAIWLLERGADASKVSASDVGELLKNQNIDVSGKPILFGISKSFEAVTLLQALVRRGGFDFNKPNQSGSEVLYGVLSRAECLEDFFTQLLRALRKELYESHFQLHCGDTLWERAAETAQLNCAVLLIKEMQLDDVRKKPLKGFSSTSDYTHLEVAKLFLGSSRAPEHSVVNQNIRQAFLDLGVEEHELSRISEISE